MLEHLKRKRQLDGNPCGNMATTVLSMPLTTPTKRTSATAKDSVIKIPPNFLEWGADASTIWPSTEQLAFPAPQRRLATLSPSAATGEGILLQLQALQHSLASRANINSLILLRKNVGL